MKYTWTVEFEVEENWVADGYQITDEVAQDMIEESCSYAYSNEVTGRVIKAPARVDILKAQNQ